MSPLKVNVSHIQDLHDKVYNVKSKYGKQEGLGQVTFKQIYTAWQHCRKRKRDKPQAQLYEVNLFDNIVNTVQALNDGTWRPLPSVCFLVSKPKMREIHAAHFSDRVVHHCITPLLEELFEPVCIHDVYSNRKNKGTHKAVERTAHFMRKIELESCGFRFRAIQSRSHALRGSSSNARGSNNMHSLAERGNEIRSNVMALTVIQQGYLKSGLRNRIINSITVKL